MRKLAFLLSVAMAAAPHACHAQSTGSTAGSSGVFVASDFNNWTLPQGTSPTSGMIQWNSAICSVSSSGYSFIAVKVGRPITIVDANPALTETVTPSFVQNNGGTCSMSAPMSHTHTSYSVKSGTAGLQEAIDYSLNLVAGAVIVLTPGWTAGGGQTSMVLAATGQTSISITDQRVGLLCSYAWSGSAYTSSGCGSGGSASLSDLSLQTFAGPLAVPAGITAPITGNVTGNLTGNVTGNVTGNLTGNVTGSASLDCALAGCTMTGPLLVGTTDFIDSSFYGTFALACAAAVAANQPLLISKPWTSTPAQTCAANLWFYTGNSATNFIQPASGQTVTLTGTIVAPNTKIFDDTAGGTVALGTQTSAPPVEWFGAVGDATGAAGVGTNNTAAFQACLNALANGQCMLLNRQYRITSALSIATSNVGIGGVSYAVANSTLYPTPAASVIVIDSASADAIDAAGTNETANITYNRFTDFTINRTQAPTGTARGLSIQFSYGAIVQGVTSTDSIAPFYFHGVGSQGTGYVENCAALWGYNGFAETAAGNYGGFIVDSTGGVAPNNSFRIRNVFIAENSNISHTGGVVTFGVDVSGSNINDFHSFHVETAGVDYGISMGTGSNVSNSSDIFISEPVFDQTWISALHLNGIIGGAVVNGGDYVRSASTTSNAPIIDIEGSDHVTVENAHLFSSNASTTGPSILVNNSGSITITGNDLGANYGDGIDFTTTVGSTITSNVINGVINGTGISLTSSSVNNVVSSNTINVPVGFTATNGILIDSSSTSIHGVETNQIGSPRLTTVLNDTSHNSSGVSGNCVDWTASGGLGDAGSPCGSGGGGGVTSINSTTGAFTFTGAGVSCTSTTCTFSGTGGGVTSFAAPSGSWPSWLVPTVTNSTTTPSLAVAASAIPNAALANPATTVAGTTCTLGSSCNPYPLSTSGSLPGTCTTGQLWTNPAPTNTGNVIYECWTTNTWAPLQPSMSGTPASISANSGAGSGSGGTASFVAGETDGAGWVTVNTGTSTTASAGVFTLSYSVTYPVTPKCVVFPADTNSAALSGTGQVWVSQSSSTGALFVVRVGSTPLAISTTYTFGYRCALL